MPDLCPKAFVAFPTTCRSKLKIMCVVSIFCFFSRSSQAWILFLKYGAGLWQARQHSRQVGMGCNTVSGNRLVGSFFATSPWECRGQGVDYHFVFCWARHYVTHLCTCSNCDVAIQFVSNILFAAPDGQAGTDRGQGLLGSRNLNVVVPDPKP